MGGMGKNMYSSRDGGILNIGPTRLNNLIFGEAV